MSSLILRQKSIVPALDTPSLDKFRQILSGTADVPQVGGYKIGFSLGLRHGLPKIAEMARELAPDKPLIYDHQKAGGDTPHTGEDFAAIMAEAGVKAAIIFPHSGPETERAWIGALQARKITPIVGAIMTHNGYLTTEGGWIDADRIWDSLGIAAEMGVQDFVGPGTKIPVLTRMRSMLIAKGVANPAIYSPGLIAQGGKLTDAAHAAGDTFHGIVGRDILNAANPAEEAKSLGKEL